MSLSPERVWLNGERFDVAYLLETSTGKIERFVSPGLRVGVTAGVARRISSEYICVYVSPSSGGVFLGVRGRSYLLDGSLVARYARCWGGVASVLYLTPPGEQTFRLMQLTLGRAFSKRVDPGYDSLDESMDDFLGDVADIVGSPRRRAWITEVKDPIAGPWNLLE